MGVGMKAASTAYQRISEVLRMDIKEIELKDKLLNWHKYFKQPKMKSQKQEETSMKFIGISLTIIGLVGLYYILKALAYG